MIKEKANIHSSDILIIGGGGAAALAALAAREAGAKVTLVTKESSLVGGATIMSAGGTSATLSPDDRPEVFLNDIMKAGGQLNNPKLAQMLAEGSAKALLSLEKYHYLLDRKEVFDRIFKILPALNRKEKSRTDFDMEKADTFVRLTKCFECLICQSACPIYEDSKENFAGPLGFLWVAQNAALANQESRMDKTEIDDLLEMCLHCGVCSDVCPCSEDILTLAFDFLEKNHDS